MASCLTSATGRGISNMHPNAQDKSCVLRGAWLPCALDPCIVINFIPKVIPVCLLV